MSHFVSSFHLFYLYSTFTPSDRAALTKPNSLETVLHTSPIQTAAWFTPMAVGGMILSIVGGLVLHILSGKILMTISAIGYLLCGLLFALIPASDDPAYRSRTFIYWAYVFPAMCASTIGIDITFTVTNVFITTAMPRRLQAAAGGLINSLLYLGIAFWLGIGELAVSSTVNSRGGDLDLRSQYRVGFWTSVGLAGVAFVLMATIKMGKASAEMTADEKAELEAELRARADHERAYGRDNDDTSNKDLPEQRGDDL